MDSRNKPKNAALSVEEKLNLIHKIDKAVKLWFETMRNGNVPINGDMVKAKAKHFAMEFNVTDFVASNGWLDRFKTR